MFDLTVLAANGQWLLIDDTEGQLGAYATRDEALAAAGDFARVDDEPRYVLIQEDTGDWGDVIVDPPLRH